MFVMPALKGSLCANMRTAEDVRNIAFWSVAAGFLFGTATMILMLMFANSEYFTLDGVGLSVTCLLAGFLCLFFTIVIYENW